MSQYRIEQLNQSVATGFGHEAWWHKHATAKGLTPITFDGPIPADVVQQIIAEDIRSEVVLSSSTLEPVEGYRRIYNAVTGTTLQMATDSYQVHDPVRWCAEAALPLIEAASDRGLGVLSVCSLGDGKYSSVTLAYPDTMTAAEMEIHPYTSFSTGAGGDFASQVNNGTIAMVCDNTIQMARGIGTVVKVRHIGETEGAYRRFVDAALDLHGYAAAICQRIEDLAATPVSDLEWSLIVSSLLGPVPDEDGRSKTIRTNKEDVIRNLYRNDMRCAPWKGTALGAFQTLNTWQQHYATVRGEHRAARNMANGVTGKQADIDSQFLSIIASVTSTPELV